MELFSNFTRHHLQPIQILSLISLGQLWKLFTCYSTSTISFLIPTIWLYFGDRKPYSIWEASSVQLIVFKNK